jgi:hypothetical protein
MPWNQDCTAGMAKLGILNFPTIASVAQDQQQFLERLKNTSVEPSLYEGLEHCGAAKCGRHECLEACRFGAYRRKRKSIPLIHWILTEHDGPLYEVRVARMRWARPFGKLRPPFDAATKVNQRALNNLYTPSLVAVGTFKVSVADGAYFSEIHQIVAGAEEDDLKRVFVPSEKVEAACFFGVNKVEKLGEVINSVLDHGLRRWEAPSNSKKATETPEDGDSSNWRVVRPFASSKITRQQWEGYYRWRLTLPYSPYGACLIRHGCNQHFNALKKALRTIRPKVRKKHPYPWWLLPRMYGNHPEYCTCRACMG